MKHRLLRIAACLALTACHGGKDRTGLCEEFFEPYMDIVSGQLGDQRSAEYITAMAHYRDGRYNEAEEALIGYIQSRRDFAKSAYLYLAISQLANGKPYEAELSIDKLEHSSVKGFADQCGWYTVICWLCSEQWERAREGASVIATTPRHAYKKQAAALVQQMERRSTE